MAATQQKQMLKVKQWIKSYRKDPAGFLHNVLGIPEEHIWDGMTKILESIRDNQFTAIRAGHSVSKTFTMGRVVPWFKICYQPSTVITTAPSDNQVRNQLWREIHSAIAGSQITLGGKITALGWDVKPSAECLENLEPKQREAWEKNFAIGFATSPDLATENCTKMQGWHNEYLLIVIDEACGIMPQIWRTIIESLVIDERCKVVAIGNPTDPECEFAKACHSSDLTLQEGHDTYTSDLGWNVVTVAGTDTPNYKQDKRVIPGLASRAFVERIVKKYGADGDGTRYRVKGLFPTRKEGTYYGFKLAACKKEGRIGLYPWDETAPVYTFSDTGDMYTATVFAQFIRGKIQVIDDYWDNEGLGIPAWCTMCNGKPYTYGGHFSGPEMAYGTAGRSQTGRSTQDIAANLGYYFQPVIKHAFDDGIEAGRAVFGRILINKESCKTYVSALSGYGKKKHAALSTDEETVYHDMPAKTWHRHMADAHRHMAIAYQYMEIGNEYLGQPQAPASSISAIGSDCASLLDC